MAIHHPLQDSGTGKKLPRERAVEGVENLPRVDEARVQMSVVRMSQLLWPACSKHDIVGRLLVQESALISRENFELPAEVAEVVGSDFEEHFTGTCREAEDIFQTFRRQQ